MGRSPYHSHRQASVPVHGQSLVLTRQRLIGHLLSRNVPYKGSHRRGLYRPHTPPRGRWSRLPRSQPPKSQPVAADELPHDLGSSGRRTPFRPKFHGFRRRLAWTSLLPHRSACPTYSTTLVTPW